MPCAATSAAVMSAVSCVADTNAVVRFAPFQRTTDPATKLVPLTVSVNAALPATIELGASEVAVGTGFEGALIVKVCAAEVPPPGAGLKTVTAAVPALCTSVAPIAAVS